MLNFLVLAVYVRSAASDSYCRVALLAPDLHVLSGKGDNLKKQ